MNDSAFLSLRLAVQRRLTVRRYIRLAFVGFISGAALGSFLPL